jgi:PadR family transcriptional regulator, regulatory protein PadR
MGTAKPADLLQGTLELLILRTLATGEKHGYEIAEWIHTASAEALAIEEGSLLRQIGARHHVRWTAAPPSADPVH